MRLYKATNADLCKKYVVDGMNTVVEQDAGGSLRYKYVYVNGLLLSRIDSYGNKGYYHRDGLGSIIGMSNGTPSVTTAQLFDDFGNWLYYDANWDYYGYTGQEYDWPLMDAYNLRAREYYPAYGRFMQQDPIGDRGGSLNWYLYVKNNPVNIIDILGLSGCTREEMINDAVGIMGKSIRFYRNNINSGMACAEWSRALENMFGSPSTKCCKMTDVGYWYFNNRSLPRHNFIRVECTSECDKDKWTFAIDPWQAVRSGMKTPIFFDYGQDAQPTGWWQ